MNTSALDNQLERLLFQLDTLVPFLGISRRETFELMEREKYLWFEEQQGYFPDSYQIYYSLIIRSAFLLGYSYYEAFLTDLVRIIYRSNPQMLPESKQIRFGEITEVNNYDEIIDILISKEVLDVFYQGMEKIVDYFNRKLRLNWTEQQKSEVVRASLMRNCFIHNSGRMDKRLAQLLNGNVGDEIVMTEGTVHSFGLIARELARSLVQQANMRYLSITA